jgi:cytochrome oxidase assembly protein ShyY1
MDRFEKIVLTIAGVLVLFCALAQWDIRREHNELLLHRQLQYQAFLEGQVRADEWTIAYREEKP